MSSLPQPKIGISYAGISYAGINNQMTTYVVLTRLTTLTARSPSELKRLEQAVSERVRIECPEVKWLARYAILGPCDHLDMFEAPNEMAAARVVMIIRSVGQAQTETWTAIPLEGFNGFIP
jgi:uncharacterized protein with GYD domain